MANGWSYTITSSSKVPEVGKFAYPTESYSHLMSGPVTWVAEEGHLFKIYCGGNRESVPQSVKLFTFETIEWDV